jgi:hypothetical protein
MPSSRLPGRKPSMLIQSPMSSLCSRGRRLAASRALPLRAPDRARGVVSAPASFVQVAYSSRRPAGVAPILGKALLHECEVLVDSLAFTQARQFCRPGPRVP